MTNNFKWNSRIKKILQLFRFVTFWLQIALTVLGTFMSYKLNFCFEMPLTLFVGAPMIFASISITDCLQKYHKAFENLRKFKRAVSITLDSLRNEGEPLKTTNAKLKVLVCGIKKVLFAEKHKESEVTDKGLTDTNQLNEQMRDLCFPQGKPLKAGINEEYKEMRQAIEDLESMKNQEPWTFHYLVLGVIFLMPIMLSSDYVHKGIKLGIKESPYVIAVLSSFLFGIAQIGVQIALDPLAYINEDDIELFFNAAEVNERDKRVFAVGLNSGANRDDSIGGVQPTNCPADAVILEMEASGTFQSNKQTKIKAAADAVKKTPVEHPTSAQVDNVLPGKKIGDGNLPIVTNRDDSISGVQPRNCTADAGDTNGNDKDLERHLAKFGLEIENVPKDGDCAFRSILRQLRKMDFDKTEELKDHLRSLNLMTESEDDDISTLRLLFVQECKKRTDDYSIFFPGPKTTFIEELMEFKRKGVFDNAVGDLVAKVCCDLLRVPITIVTSSLPKEETEFKPDRLLSNSPIFIAYHHYGAGHYDATNFIPTSAEEPNKTVTSCSAEPSTSEEQPDDKKQQHPNVGQATPRELEKTITRTFVCLAGRDQLTVPTNREKLLLKENGLGEKKLQIPTNASKEQVKEVLYKAFRPLQSCGGFEMLLCADNSRTRLQVVNYGSCNTDKLRWLGMSRVYIRPIQVDIPLGNIEDDDEQAEECLLCRESIPLRGMRAHMETCRSETRPAETSDDDLPPAFGERREEERVNPAELPNQPPGGTEQNSLELPEQPPRGAEQASISHDEAAANEEEPVPYEEHMRNALEETLKAMATCDEPVAVLGEFRRRLQRGRMLDLQNDSELCEGKTTEIFVSRDCLFDDAMEEILRDDPAAIDFSVPLELHHGKPSLSFLFRKTAVLPMTYPKLVKLLDPIFSDEVTDQRRREERKYRLFLNYLKEVSAGRRMDGNVSLHSILKFVTGRENEPVLGFQMKPTICFSTNMPSCLPTSNTCISRLTLPIDENVPMTQEEVFSLFDWAFANDYLIDSL